MSSPAVQCWGIAAQLDLKVDARLMGFGDTIKFLYYSITLFVAVFYVYFLCGFLTIFCAVLLSLTFQFYLNNIAVILQHNNLYV